MSDAKPNARKSRLTTIAVVLSSLVIAMPLFVGRLVEAILDTVNPADVDVTHPLAYLREILGWGFGSLGLLFVIIVVILVVLYRRAKTLDAIALPLGLVAIQIVVGVAILLLSGLTNPGTGS